MNSQVQPAKENLARFRTKLFAAMMIIVATLSALGLYFAQGKVTADAERDLQQNFQAELSSLHKLEDLRHAALAERCNALAAKPRIHAALEDNALDLLYPSAKDELRDLMEGEESPSEQTASTLHAKFYRFLDRTGAVLPPPNSKDVGVLSATAEAQLALKKLPEKQQVGYIRQHESVSGSVSEVTAVPIFSTETGDVISALIFGFKPFEPATRSPSAGMKSGIWIDRRLHLPSLSEPTRTALASTLTNLLANGNREPKSFTIRVNGARHLLFVKRLNPDSLF